MQLNEYKGKEILKSCGINIPKGLIVNNKNYTNISYFKEQFRDFFLEHRNIIIKSQIITSSRKKKGLIKESNSFEESLKLIDELYKKKYNNSYIKILLIEEKLNIAEEYFVSFTYDTSSRSAILLFSRKGGINIEENAKQIFKLNFSLIFGLQPFRVRQIIKNAGFKGSEIIQIASFIMKAYDCFLRFDCMLCEINPIIKTINNKLYASDAKIIIDSNSKISKDFLFVQTEEQQTLTLRELQARKIDRDDYRGVAGKTFVDMDGDVAVLCSGGGASLTCMDEIIKLGGKPANYVEYSGNPSREKVRKLTEITLNKPNLKGCIVIGGIANFTDIYETLMGFADGLKNLKEKPKYPIVIRRGGPNYKKAFKMLNELAQKEGYNITTYTPEISMSSAIKKFIEKTKNYKESSTVNNI